MGEVIGGSEGAFDSFVRITAIDLNDPIETKDDYLADYLGSAVIEELYQQAEKHGASFDNDGMILTMSGVFDLHGIVAAVIAEMKNLAKQVERSE